MFVCGYTGAWYCAPRRRRRRGESPIRMPRLHTTQGIPSVLFGLHCSAAVFLRGWSLFLSSLLEKGSLWLEPTLNGLVVIWPPLQLFLYINLTAAYLAWALMVILELIVPPWWCCLAILSLFAGLRLIPQPPPQPYRWHFA